MEEEIKGQDTPKQETPPAESVESLKSQLADLQSKYEQSEKGLKTARQTASEKTREAKEAREMKDLISSITTRLDAHEEILKASNEVSEYEEDDTPKKKRTNLDTKLAEIKQRSIQAQFNTLAQEAEDLAKGVGLDVRSSPELDTVRDYFKSGDISLAKKAITLLERMKENKAEEPKVEDKTPKESEEQKINRLVEERVKSFLKDKGLLTPEGGVPSGTVTPAFTAQQIAAMSPEEYKERKPQIDEAFRQGRIK